MQVTLKEAYAASSEILVDDLKLSRCAFGILHHDRSKTGLFIVTSSDYHRVSAERMKRPMVIEDQLIQIDEEGVASVTFQSPEILDGIVNLLHVDQKIESTTIQFIIKKPVQERDIL